MNKILDNFDFQKVHHYMMLTNWCYYDSKVPPTIERLKAVAADLLECIAANTNCDYASATGGFHAYKWTNRDGQIYFELLFAIEDQSTY